MNIRRIICIFSQNIRNILYFVFVLIIPLVNSIRLDVNNPESIKEVASRLTENLMYYFSGTPGLFKGPVYWWQSGAAWNVCIFYLKIGTKNLYVY